jgi:hypothetical protein
MGTIFCSPVGGLANKLRHVVSARVLAENLGYDFFICDWINNDITPGFDNVFKTNESYKISTINDIVDLNIYYQWVSGRGVNLRKFSDPSKEDSILSVGGFYDLNVLKTFNTIHFAGLDTIVILDKPIEQWNKEYDRYLSRIEINETIENKIPEITDNVIGVHIRRGDNALAIKNSPTEKFINFFDQNKDKKIFLSTDDMDLEILIKSKYDNVFVNEKTGFHDNKTIIRSDIRTTTDSTKSKEDLLTSLEEAVTDLYTLSRCKTIYGCSDSSFTAMASKINNSKLILIK